MFSILLATILFSTNSVSFTAVSTDCGVDTQLEFLFVGPNSDRDYEAMFVTDDPIDKIADAFEKAGFTLGRAINQKEIRFWPVGNKIEMKPSFTELVREMRKEKIPSIIYTGGSRDEKGKPYATTNMPAAVFALYNCDQSLIQLNDSLDQSVAYGRFQPAIKIPKGERQTFTFTWDGVNNWEQFNLKITTNNLTESIRELKEKSEKKELDVLTDFSKEMTVKDAVNTATLLSMIDSVKVKINSFTNGQLFYRAFLPDELWRDRTKRLAQPPEVHLCKDGSIIVSEIKEDWSRADETEPILSVETKTFTNVEQAGKLISKLAKKTFSLLIFAPSDTKLSRIYELRENVSNRVINWYVFKKD